MKACDGCRGNGGTRLLQAATAAAAALLLAGACGTNDPMGPDPETRSEAELTFLRQAADAPPLLTTDTSLVATRGEDLRVRIFYAPERGSGSERGDLFLELEIDDESLLRYPAGHPKGGDLLEPGDTITIRIHIDPDRLLANLEPAGLEFDPSEPAQLELRYTNADRDFDGDGAPDPEREEEIDLWRQEKPEDPWVRIGELKDRDLKRVRARLTSFSRYALAI